MPTWVVLWGMFHPDTGWLAKKNYLLFGFGVAVQVLMLWILAEAVLIWKKVRSYLPTGRQV